jgi:hypothetical protein
LDPFLCVQSNFLSVLFPRFLRVFYPRFILSTSHSFIFTSISYPFFFRASSVSFIRVPFPFEKASDSFLDMHSNFLSVLFPRFLRVFYPRFILSTSHSFIFTSISYPFFFRASSVSFIRVPFFYKQTDATHQLIWNPNAQLSRTETSFENRTLTVAPDAWRYESPRLRPHCRASTRAGSDE